MSGMAMKSSKVKKDEVRDEQGRQRFHGAFTGGFSAGYYNSVGSKEGWAPSTFQSSRKNRAEARQQRPEDFMDEDDGLLGRDLEAQLPYDTLGEVSKKMMREQAEKQAVGSAIPGIVVDELLAPSSESIGKRLLQMMGWREGLGVGSRQLKRARPGSEKEKRGGGGKEEEDDEEDEGDDLMPWADSSMLPAHLRDKKDVVQQGKITYARRNDVRVELPTPKNNLHGLGFDPMRDAPEFAAFRLDAQGTDDDRGVYRMADVMSKGRGTSSRAGPRDATGFALDDDEDDVYEGDMGPPNAKRYDMEISAGQLLMEDEDDGHPHGAKAKRRALDQWIGDSGGGGGAEGGGKEGVARSRVCATDGRSVPPGFVLAVAEEAGFKKEFWEPPTPPRDFRPFHRFADDEVDHRAALAKEKAGQRGGQLSASSRGVLLGESKPAALEVQGKTVTSVFDLMSEEDRRKILGGGGGERGPSSSSSQQAQQGQPPVFQGMQGALAKRFSVVESTVVKNDLPATGLIHPSTISKTKPPASASAPTAPAPAPALSRSAKPLKEPTRTQTLWYPGALLCKRFNVPVPMHAKGAPQALPPRPVTVEVRSDERFQQEIGVFLPGAGLLTGGGGGQQQDASGLPLPIEEISQGEEGGGVVEEREVELPSFEEKERPPMDFFKAIFEEDEGGDSDDDDDDEDEEEEEKKEEGAPPPATTGPGAAAGPSTAPPGAPLAPAVRLRSPGPSLAADAPTPPRLSPARDGFFLQPVAPEDILGPVMLRKKRPQEEEEEGEEDEGPVIFGAAGSKKRLKPGPAAVPSSQAMPSSGGGGAGSDGDGDSSSTDSSGDDDDEEGNNSGGVKEKERGKHKKDKKHSHRSSSSSGKKKKRRKEEKKKHKRHKKDKKHHHKKSRHD